MNKRRAAGKVEKNHESHIFESPKYRDQILGLLYPVRRLWGPPRALAGLKSEDGKENVSEEE